MDQAAPHGFVRDGCLVMDSFLFADQCTVIRDAVDALRRQKKLIQVDRAGRSSVSRFATMNGTVLEKSIPLVARLHAKVRDFVRRVTMVKQAQKTFDRCTKSTVWKRPSPARRTVSPTAGRMLVFHGNRCLHGVRPVRGSNP